MIADLARQEALEIYDQETNILIYRRRPPSKVSQKRIFRLETHLVPLWRLDDSLESHFQYFYKGIERHGFETAMQMFQLYNSTSLYLSGRVVLKTYERWIDGTFSCIALLRDPYMELAERLLTLRLVRKLAKEVSLLGERDMIAYGAAIDFAEAIDSDKKALHRAFATMPTPVIAVLRNPFTRQLAARNSDEVPTKGAVGAALRTLSSFSVVGLREHQDLFLAQLADLVGTSPDTLPIMTDFTRSAELCEQLKGVPEAAVLLDQDLELYAHVKAAVVGALSD
jgi:hypothetical protein